MLKTIVVFGGAGFIGSHFFKELAAQKTHKLICVDLVKPEKPVPLVEYLIGDVRNLSDFEIDGEIELIVNFAAVHKTPGHPEHAYYETNVLGALDVCRFARRKKVSSIIFTSSISVYGPGEQTKTEASSLCPVSAYGHSKMMAERIHRSWMEENESNRLIICRPAVIFGNGEKGNFTRLAKMLKKGFFVYPGRKDTIKGCLYVKDLVKALMSAWKRDERFILFNGCYPDRYTIEQIVETFRKTVFPKAKTVLLPRFAILLIASMLKPFSAMGLGIHPDRVMKLVESTDIVPQWLISSGLAKSQVLKDALEDWNVESNGTFD